MNKSFSFKELCLNLKKYYYVYVIIFFSAFILCFGVKTLQPEKIVKCSFVVDISEELTGATKKEINSTLYKVEKMVREESFLEEIIGTTKNSKNEKFKIVDSLRFYYDLKGKTIAIGVENDDEEKSYMVASLIRENLIGDLKEIYTDVEVGELNTRYINNGNSTKYYVIIAVCLGLLMSIIAFGITLSRRK